MQKYEGVKEGPKPREIIQIMRTEHGCEISYDQAWESKEYAENAVRGKYKGVLLVARALDGNSNLYPIAFGVVDSENDLSWEWFLRQLNAVIADDQLLAFISDRNTSVLKALAKVFTQSTHGICIHHLLNNVVTFFKTKGLTGLIAKASKEYRVADFERKFNDIKNISPLVGNYLVEAGIEKWARCKFSGFRYDVRTTNPAESMNTALRSPREYPRGRLSAKHKDPLTIEVEKKIGRRIEKGKTFIVYPVNQNQFLVRGDKIDCLVDLELRSCSCGKYDLLKIPCRHAIKAASSVDKELQPLTDDMYTTATWRKAYEECINPIGVPEDSWQVPVDVEHARVLPPETRRAAGRRKKRRYETMEDKIRSSQGSQGSRKHKCSRCGVAGHKRGTCDIPI
ncbi:uncharacterized protein LOC112084590 [Eutrema salsugineum]|uniref:uncharacterized protein LOC112084590 n=1 Tax=Eutrema salsugineum TaxID=72664 RepID=UPI000CED5EFE|nr:uncharacterized protein LOC112084590 [Eutrema salsugineum]